MHALVATGNRHKVEELQQLLQGNLELETPETWDGVDEYATTLWGNARLKATALHKQTSASALADDSGIFVRALDGTPGVRSARFAGESASDSDNNAKLLTLLADRDDRFAWFGCVLTLVHERFTVSALGKMVGSISAEPRGENGFGYDPLFIPDGQTETLGELGAAFKQQHSHRARAAKALIQAIEKRGLHLDP